ncbi:FHA domain-containing protein [Candidatus Chloroploca sp. M-50]|uniref:FHA domain-containing protein n=2 Tax=Candidatus Chloroploca mongolica TaxID=2528176 RepID=A0ABS4D6Z4_9CHLR|nr:FHA domain-containing protein [Candidatus Chloroploca mongolica]
MITCPSCGALNDPANRFCDQCGARLTNDQPASPPPPVAVTAAPAPVLPTAPVCPSCGASVLPGEAFCDNCGADLQMLWQQLAAASSQPASPPSLPQVPLEVPAAPESSATTPEPVAPAPVETEPVAPAPVMEAVPIVSEPEAQPVEAEPVAPAPVEAEPVAPAPIEAAPVAPVMEAVPVVHEPEPEPVSPMPIVAEPVAPAPALEAEPSVSASAPVAPSPVDVATYEAQRNELEAELARQAQIIIQFEQMQATFGAATPAAVVAGLAEAREAYTRIEASLAALVPPAPTVDPAVVSTLQATVARQQQIISQFEQMQATFGAATPASVAAGLAEAREVLIRAQDELNKLGLAPDAASAAVAPVAPPAPAAVAPVAPPSPVAPPPLGPHFVIADGGQMLTLPTDRAEIIVGREDPVSSIFPEIDLTSFGGETGGVSRKHARITHKDGQWMLTDLDSTNHTRINGERLLPNVPTPLPDQAKVQFGKVVVTFHA